MSTCEYKGFGFRFPQIILFAGSHVILPGSYAERSRPPAQRHVKPPLVVLRHESRRRCGSDKISLGDKATLNLPEGFTRIPAKKRRYLCVKW